MTSTIKNPPFYDVVILDDNKIVTKNLEEDFEIEEISSCSFHEPKTFLDSLQSFITPSFFVIDYNLQHELNGIDVLKELIEQFKEGSFILHSGNTTHITPEESNFLKVNNIRIVKKPNSDLLIDTIKETLCTI